MNRFFTLLFAASCLTAVGQVTYPYNPDGNADGDIAVGDLQDFLGTYGNPFSPSEIQVGDSTLAYWVEQLSHTVLEQQEMINVLQASVGRAFGPAVTPPWPDFEGGTSVFWEEGTWDNDVWLSGVIGNVNSGWAYYYTPTEDGFLTGRANSRFFIQQIDEVGAERAILNIYSVPDDPSFCIPLVKGVNYRIIRQSSLLDISWTPILSSGPLSIDDDSSASDNSGPCQGELTVNYHGHDYELVEIGDQCWFAENVRFLPRKATSGANVNQGSEDNGLPYSYVYGEDSNDLDIIASSATLAEFGALYNFQASIVWDLCPSGWHIPSDADWMTLEAFVGVPESELTSTNWRGTEEEAGKKLKSIFWSGTDEYGFGALPGGARYSANDWQWLGGPGSEEPYALFMTSSFMNGGEVAIAMRAVRFDEEGIWRGPLLENPTGLSVRCIKDAE